MNVIKYDKKLQHREVTHGLLNAMAWARSLNDVKQFFINEAEQAFGYLLNACDLFYLV